MGSRGQQNYTVAAPGASGPLDPFDPAEFNSAQESNNEPVATELTEPAVSSSPESSQ